MKSVELAALVAVACLAGSLFLNLGYLILDKPYSESIQLKTIVREHKASEPQQLAVETKKVKYEAGSKFAIEILLPLKIQADTSVFVENLRSSDLSATLRLNQTLESKTVDAIPVANGFFFKVPESNAATELGERRLVLHGGFSAVSRPKALLINSYQSITKNNQYNIVGGATLGALLAIAIFSGMVAFLSRDRIYIVFCAWVFSTGRIALINGGWDSVWLGLSGAGNALDIWLTLSLALHPLLTCLLFRGLFIHSLPKSFIGTINSAIYFGFAFAVAALFLPNLAITKLVWIVSLCAIALCFVGIILVYKRNHSRTATLFICGWFAGLAGNVGEIVYAAQLSSGFWHTIFNSHNSAVVSVVFTACALAERLNAEKLATRIASNDAFRALNQFHELYHDTPAGLATVNREGFILSCNTTFKEFFKDVSHNLGKWESLGLNPLPQSLNSELLREETVSLTSGAKKTFRIQFKNRKDDIQAAFIDITAQKIAEEKLQEAANRDPLTNLYNRFKIIDLLEQRLVTNIESTVTTDCIAMVDIDAFDRVITNFGHGVGDDVLLAYRNRIQELLPTTATLGRLSADTLIVLMPNTPLNEARYVVQAILNSIHKAPFETRVLTVAIKASAGVSVIEAKSSKEVLAACDSALQDAKAKGGGQLIAYGERDKAWLAHKAEQELMAEFSQAIPFDRFEIVMQPIVNLLNAKEDIRYEALIRMKDKDGNLLTPALFLPALEKIGLMSQLDRWVVRQVLEFLEGESDHFARLTYASVNLSGASINDERFTDELLRLAAKHPHLIRKVCFEITENIALADMEATKRFIHRLRIIGARIALDDFGAGYSSFSYLAQLKVDSIKIDGSLISGLDEDLAKQAIVKTIVDLGKALGSEVVAEWVETPKTLALLGRLGVDAGQGWALGKPVAMSAIAAAEHGASFVKDKNIAAILGITLPEHANA
jgi:diguanylate cyclase (GGDEF)-like protein